MTMRVITLQEPWASLIAANIKKIETRSWPCYEYGDLYIHAGLSKIKSSEVHRLELLKLIPTALHYGEIFIKPSSSNACLLPKNMHIKSKRVILCVIIVQILHQDVTLGSYQTSSQLKFEANYGYGIINKVPA